MPIRRCALAAVAANTLSPATELGIAALVGPKAVANAVLPVSLAVANTTPNASVANNNRVEFEAHCRSYLLRQVLSSK